MLGLFFEAVLMATGSLWHFIVEPPTNILTPISAILRDHPLSKPRLPFPMNLKSDQTPKKK